jgi:hypothetical protein
MALKPRQEIVRISNQTNEIFFIVIICVLLIKTFKTESVELHPEQVNIKPGKKHEFSPIKKSEPPDASENLGAK